MLVEGGFEVGTGEHHQISFFLRSGGLLCRSLFLVEGMDVGLFVCNDRAGREERFCRLDGCIELDAYISRCLFLFGDAVQKAGGYRLARCSMDIFNLATVDFLSVVADDVVEVVLVEIGEGEIIADFHGGSLLVEVEELDVLVDLPHLFRLRFDTAVGIYHAVDAEIAIGGGTVLAIVAAIGPVFAPVVCLGGKALVYPIPDTATLEDGIFFDDVPILLEVAEAVAHGMGILAKNEGTRHLLVPGILLQIGRGSVHRAVDVRIPFQQCAFILDGTTVERLQGVVGNVEIQSVSGFVAQRPDDD